MPHINRIRVNNVKYNFGTQYYDDFVLRLSGKNTIYDLANGGGKSVLMLLLLQNMLPNCTLDEKQPIEKLFRSGNNNTVIHSLVEWRLNDSDVKDNYKYMTTGFCARRAQKDNAEEEGESSRDTASIEYFNYCIFYREFNANDIVNLPLSDDKERISYNGLKAYLRALEKKDYSLEIKIFERKGDYQRFISQYGIYESEWEIIRGINKTEGHVRTYFETNYKTTRKVVEDMFIDEIIEKSFRNKIAEYSKDEDPMAQTLLDIKDKLVELSAKNGEIQNFDRQSEVLLGFTEQMGGLEASYDARKNAEKTLLGIYNYAAKAEADEVKEKESLAEERMLLLKELEEVKRSADTAQISIEDAKAKRLVGVLEDKEHRITLVEDKLTNLKAELKQKESANDYLDYIYYRTERDKLKEELDNIMKDKGELSGTLGDLAVVIKRLGDEKLVTLRQELSEQRKITEEDSDNLRLSIDKERDTDKELAILNNRLNDIMAEEKSVASAYNVLQGEAGLLVGADVSALILKNERIIEEAGAVIADLESRGRELHDALIEAQVNFDKAGSDITRLNAKVDKDIKAVEVFKEDKKRIQAMRTAYEVKSVEELAQVVLKNYRILCERQAELVRKGSECEDILEGYNSNQVTVNTKERDRIKDYIERCYGFRVINGEDYLLGVPEEDREAVVERCRVLPFALMVESADELEKLSADDSICPEEIGVFPVPIMAVKEFEEYDSYESGKDIFFPTIAGRWYTDETLKAEHINKLTDKLASLKDQLLKNMGQEKILKEDYEFICNYRSVYGDKENKIWDEYERANAELENAKAKREETVGFIQSYTDEIKRSEEELASKKNQKAALLRENERLDKIAGYAEKLTELAEQKKRFSEQIAALTKTALSLKSHIEDLTSKKKAGEDRIHSILAAVSRIEDEWESLYKAFYRNTDALKATSYDRLDYEAAALKFAGVKSAFDKEYAGTEDKRQLLNNFEFAMSKSLQTLAYNEANEEKLAEAYNSHALFKTEKEELLRIRDAINRSQSELKLLQKEATATRDEKNRIEGSVSHAIKSIIEKYGVYEELDIGEENPTEYVAARKLEIEELTKRLKQLEVRLNELEEKNRDFVLMKKELERIFKVENIRLDAEAVLIADENMVEVLYDKTIKEYDAIRKEIFERREDFARSKQRLVEMLLKLNAHGLATELRDHVDVPTSSQEVVELKNNVEETISYIKLEKERVMRGIEDMQAMKDNFENQCLQTCENIKLELDKLSKLSTIRMDDEVISIIGLQIPYVSDEERKENMSKYIDKLVHQADEIDNTADRLKHIRNGLSWKRLFAVIVTDMNAIRLNLYKRERIKEQSRYLRYEEAVGSTGQSQGIYIQFLIGVINYISNINSPNAQTGLRKVIFIDNPFGAAKDIYIWEPIFKLLKTNSVQLIVPARGATPAITGRFDVNYVLGQKLVGGRQQTVVVDYFSNVSRDNLEYKAINYEQATLEL